MIKRLLSVGVVAALLCGVCATSVFGKTGSDRVEPATKSAPAVKNEAKSNEKLKADINKLVANAKAGKLSTGKPSPFQPTKRNNLSTGAKIGIVAAIAGVIFCIVAWRVLNSDDD